ncbi:MAG: hypothetical protein AB7G51_08445 [Steroidobacteraceae bacterium]
MAIKQEIITDDKDHQRALAKAQKDVERLEAKYVKLAGTQKNNAAATRRQHKEADTAVLGQISGLLKVDLALKAVHGTVGLVRQAYQFWQQDMAKLAAESKKTNDSIIKELTLTGDLARGGELQQFFRSSATVSEAQRAEAFFGVRNAAPFQTVQRTRELTAASERVALLGQDIGQFGALVGELADAFPKSRAEDLADLALAVQQRAGDQAGKLADPAFQRSAALLRAVGVGEEESLAIGLKALDANISTKALDTFAAKLATADSATKAKLLTGDRAALLKELGDQGLKISQIDFAGSAELAKQLRADTSGDYVGRQIAAAGKTAAGAELQRDIEIDRETQFAELRDEFRARGIERGRKELSRRDREGGASIPARLLRRGLYEYYALMLSEMHDLDTAGGHALEGVGMMTGSPDRDRFRENREREVELFQMMLGELQSINREQLKGSDVRRNAQALAPRGAETHTEGTSHNSWGGGVSRNKW